jgi:hypothetical protein
LGLFGWLLRGCKYNTNNLIQSVEPYIYSDGGPPSEGQYPLAYYRQVKFNFPLKISYLVPMCYEIAQPSIDARLDVVEGVTQYDFRCSVPDSTVCHARAEIVQSEHLYADIRDALKILKKMDFDKLIVSVRIHLYYLLDPVC